MSHVFVSYSHDDEDCAFSLESRLRGAGIDTFVDAPKLEPGDEWREKIKVALDSSYAVVVICTASAMASHEVTFEWSYAMGLGISVIPVIFEKGVGLHSRLDTLQYVDFSEIRSRNWNQLFQVLNDAKRNYVPTKGFLWNAGISNILFSRNELNVDYSIQQILDRCIPNSELIVVARSCEGWARQYLDLENAINQKHVKIMLAMVKPDIPRERWMIPSDYAQLDTSASVGKLRMITIAGESEGSLSLTWLPSSPLFSFVYFQGEDSISIGILEAGASLPLSERTSLILHSNQSDQGLILQRFYKIYKRVLEEGERALSLGSFGSGTKTDNGGIES